MYCALFILAYIVMATKLMNSMENCFMAAYIRHLAVHIVGVP